jgi:hypothetical protein
VITCNLIPFPIQCPITGIGSGNPAQALRHHTFQVRKFPAPAPSAPALSVESKALPLEWLLAPKSDTPTERALARIVQFEAHEPDVWLREDYRQAFITVALAAKGSPMPFVEASYIMYGLHPDKLWPAVLARRAALLGTNYPTMTADRFPMGTGRLVDEEPSADGTSSLPAYDRDGKKASMTTANKATDTPAPIAESLIDLNNIEETWTLLRFLGIAKPAEHVHDWRGIDTGRMCASCGEIERAA